MKKNPINDYYALLNLLSQINSPLWREFYGNATTKLEEELPFSNITPEQASIMLAIYQIDKFNLHGLFAQEIVTFVKTLSAKLAPYTDLLSRIAKGELNPQQIDNIQYKTKLKNLLLQGPTMSEAQYEAHLQLREELNQWR